MSAAREALNWPHGDFAVHDPSPDDDHSAIYLICPGGLMVNTSGDPTPGLDAKRTAWMAENLNAALALPSPRSREGDEADREMIDSLIVDLFCEGRKVEVALAGNPIVCDRLMERIHVVAQAAMERQAARVAPPLGGGDEDQGEEV